MSKPKPKLDIFETLGAIDQRDFNFVASKPEDVMKAFSPVVVMRWASSPIYNSDDQILKINNRVNKRFWDVSDHPDLLYRLMASCGTSKRNRYQWLPIPKADKKTNVLIDFIWGIFPHYNEMEVKLFLRKFDKEEFQLFLLSCAVDEKTEKELLNGFEKFNRDI